ncbi:MULTISPECIES: EAL domain-containing protein [Enterobacteriaceae]|uniref:Fimbrial protein n=1 Tax=Klebsiella pneumoniae TaxID=573 RepID=A0A486VZV8_KLEPN|nr:MULTISPECIES: EAL domain-containing protein [Enterobacteriaceae]HDS3618616.1 EAL domain-containing protein [Klebsiella pneumoniae subsp. pneumoniae]EHH4358269.1 EAL domain-containing protein [Escherichia coli]EIT7441333.1 EAL domain-containing protein [Escherichia coli]EKJ4545643.1 EAL domain-containing protein [Escherichia coli]MBO3721426.1 EAL domain-containing protein [Klebsiella pneumoniae]
MNNIETDFMRDVGTKFIYPVYQPIVNGHRRIVGFEMLIRWCVNGVEKQPQDFLPYFNEKKLWLALTAVMLETAAKKVNYYGGKIYFSINIPAVLLGDEQLYELLDIAKRLLVKDDWYDCLVLEIPENICLESKVLESINHLYSQGWRLELDDCFSVSSGTFPIKTVRFSGYKLDRSIIATFLADSYEASLIRALNYFCVLTGSRCTAEGVDDHQKFSMLAKLGIDNFQGYEISKPVPDAELDDLVRFHCYQQF